jgi:hypothetical protein
MLFILQCVVRGAIVLDKQFFGPFSEQDTSDWTIQGYDGRGGRSRSDCGAAILFGGYQKFTGHSINPSGVEKTYSMLKPHYRVTVTVKVFAIDSWAGDLILTVDGQSATLTLPQAPSTDTCGGAANDEEVVLTKTVLHWADSLTVSLTSNSVDPAVSWGLREFTLDALNCHPICLTCNGPLSVDCLSCPTGLSPTFAANGVNVICGCPIKYQHEVNKITGATATCQTTCQSGYLQSGSNATLCEDCPSFCAVCTDTTNTFTDCSQCTTGYYPGATIMVTPYCTACPTGCASCTGGNPSTDCSACTIGYYLEGTGCQTFCPATKVASETGRACVACDGNCLGCYGTTNLNCLACAGGKYLQLDGSCVTLCQPNFLLATSCVINCGIGKFPNVYTYTCDVCATGCDNCAGLTNCLACTAGWLPYRTVCVSTCPPDSILAGSSCPLCFTTCATCSSTAQNACLSCISGLFMNSFQQCVTICPRDHFVNLLQVCQLCIWPCTVCASATVCTGCAFPYYLHLNQSVCQSTCAQARSESTKECWSCAPGYYQSEVSCEPCYLGCLSCHGTAWNECRTCLPGRQPTLGSCLCMPGSLEIKGECLPVAGQDYRDSALTAVVAIAVLTLLVGALLELLFSGSAGLLRVIEFFQLTSYLGFLSLPLPTSLQSMFDMLYKANPGAWIVVGHWQGLYFEQPGQIDNVKFAMRGKTGLFYIDILGSLVFILVLGTLSLLLYLLKQQAVSSRWPSEYCYRFAWQKFFPSLLTLAINLTVLDGMLCCCLGILNYSNSIFSAVMGGAGLVAMVMPALLSDTLEEWFSDPEVIYTEEGVKPDESRGVYFGMLTKLPMAVLLIMFAGQPYAQAALITLISSAFLLSQFFVPYNRLIVRVMHLLEHLGVAGASLGVLLTALYPTDNFHMLAQAFVVMAVLGILLMQLALAVANAEFIVLQLRALLPKWRIMQELSRHAKVAAPEPEHFIT